METTKSVETQQSRVAYLSFLNVIAAVAVVILHANGAFWGYRSGAEWKMNNVLECLFFFAVPVFFMLTGATLLDYRDRYDTKTFLQKRFSKTFIPFLFWSLFAFVIKIFSAENPKEYFLGAMRVEKIFNGIFNTEYQEVFWFFIPLFCVYLSIPLLSAIPKEKKIPVFTFTVAIAGIINVDLPFLFSLINRFGGKDFRYGFQIPDSGDYRLSALRPARLPAPPRGTASSLPDRDLLRRAGGTAYPYLRHADSFRSCGLC